MNNTNSEHGQSNRTLLIDAGGRDVGLDYGIVSVKFQQVADPMTNDTSITLDYFKVYATARISFHNFQCCVTHILLIHHIEGFYTNY